ncbi:hypothetical protein Pcinc_019304 [Petrolisthes cinctipes]|uniref:Uncharacterized protein n=1 Tax=Petrolisthes cinctipes TaxID=88211 RepID=A0AAE1FL64_PETCI|nr:hypothetical protein Pcinc_019304 [Petrolisthes cinctipes]
MKRGQEYGDDDGDKEGTEGENEREMARKMNEGKFDQGVKGEGEGNVRVFRTNVRFIGISKVNIATPTETTWRSYIYLGYYYDPDHLDNIVLRRAIKSTVKQTHKQEENSHTRTWGGQQGKAGKEQTEKGKAELGWAGLKRVGQNSTEMGVGVCGGNVAGERRKKNRTGQQDREKTKSRVG